MPAAPTLDFLTGLRRLAALWVLGHHAWAMPGAMATPVPGVWNVLAPSISAEWAAYLLFPLLVLPARRGLARRWLSREPPPT
jgi:peptidoglycan/LPS O-acetylase OafA/YrhL